jgi:23S rRNA (adenine2503-C2)-methyltransferase
MTLIADINILNKKDIRKLTLDDLKAWLVEQGEKPFRAKQVYEWLWKHSAQ